LTWALGKPAAVLTKPPGLVGRLTVEKNVDHARFIQFLFKYIIKFLSKSLTLSTRCGDAIFNGHGSFQQTISFRANGKEEK
jgi:hypothetical protein